MAEIKKILIVRFSSIGDIVLTTPVIRVLKDHFPDAEVHYLTKFQYKGILVANPYISKIHTLKDDWREMILDLKNEKFDLLIDLHFNLRTRLLKWNLKIPSYSFNKINFQKWLMVNLKIDRLPNVHIVDRYIDVLKHLDIQNDGKGLDYFVPVHDEVNMNDHLSDQNISFDVYAIGGQHETKKLPLNRIREIADKHDGYMVLLGGKEDYENGEKIAFDHDNIVNLCGKLNINQSASVVSQARCVITHDTGMMHIAAAFNKKIISIWGNTIPEFGMSPYLPHKDSKTIEIKDLSCRPCSKIGYSKCPKGHFKCMNLIDTDLIIDALKN